MILRRLLYWLRSREHARALGEELEFHQAMTQEALERDGLTPEAARLAGRRAIGNTTLARENARAIWIWPWLDSVRQDVGYAVRSLARQPGFTLASLIVLGVATGLNASLFTVFAGLAIRPMAGLADPSRVVTVSGRNPPQVGGVSGLSFPEYAFLAAQTSAFSGLAAEVAMPVQVETGRDTRSITSYLVTANFFDVLGVSLEHGRGFLPGEDRRDAGQQITVLSYALWQTRFAGDPRVVGRSLRINGAPFTVVGVASRDFVGAAGSSQRLWLPISIAPRLRPNDPFASELVERPDSCCVTVTGRLAPAMTRARALAETQVSSQRFRASVGQRDRPLALAGTQFLAGRSAAPQVLAILGVLLFGMLLVLLIACANVSNLLLARAAARVGEIGVRLSLGAGRTRIVRQLLTEGLVLAIAASVAGTLVATWLPPVALRVLSGEGRPFDVDPDRWVFAYAFALAVVSCVAFALAPALHATRCDIASALRGDSGSLRSRFPLRSALLAVQVAVTVILLTSAGLLLRGVVQARAIDPGFVVDDVAVARIVVLDSAYGPARMRAFVADLASGLRAAGLGSFGLASFEPLPDGHATMGVRLPSEGRERTASADVLNVSSGYFGALGLPIVAGRAFTDADARSRVAVINQTMAHRYWPDGNPIGRTLVAFIGGPGDVSIEVVGVVKDARLMNMDAVEPIVFLPPSDRLPRLVFRTSEPMAAAKITAAVERIDRTARVEITPLRDRLDDWLGEITLAPIAASALGVFALVIATVGMLGVFSYAVRQRTREIGIRMALGAGTGDVVRLVLSSSLRAVVVGLAVGGVGSLVASQVLRSALYGLSPLDPIAYGAVMLVLALAACAASYVPARRAMRIDPVRALRYE